MLRTLHWAITCVAVHWFLLVFRTSTAGSWTIFPLTFQTCHHNCQRLRAMLKRLPQTYYKLLQLSTRINIGTRVQSSKQPLFYHSVRSIWQTPRANSEAAANGDSVGNTKAFLQPSDNLELKNTFYQRKLPETLIKISSAQGKQLFREAMDAGQTEGFFPLTGAFASQSSPSYCGPSSCKIYLSSL